MRRSGNISVHVIAGDQLPGGPLPKKTVDTSERAEAYDPRPYVVALVAVAVALGCGELVNNWIGVENVDLVFLTAIVGVAARFGLLPSLFASVVSALAYNFFFLPPIYTFTIADPHNIAAFALFTIVAIIVSNVAARSRTQAVTAQTRVRAVESIVLGRDAPQEVLDHWLAVAAPVPGFVGFAIGRSIWEDALTRHRVDADDARLVETVRDNYLHFARAYLESAQRGR